MRIRRNFLVGRFVGSPRPLGTFFVPVYVCRWPNGDCSFVSATSRDEAIVKLDEIGNAEPSEVFRVPDFMLHLNLNDDGTFGVEGFGDETIPAIDKVYPILCQAEHTSLDAIRSAVGKERVRLEEEDRPA